MVALHGLYFTLQPLDGFLVRGNLITQILDFSFQGFRLTRSPTDSSTQKLAPFLLVEFGAFLADSPVKVFTLLLFLMGLFYECVGNTFRLLYLLIRHLQLMLTV